MSTEGLSDSDFFLELELYDVIRPSTWQSWNLAAANQVARPAPSIASSSQSSSQGNNLPRLDPEANFWKNLETCVSSKYDFDDTEMLISELQEMLEEKMKECSLDELERLAASIKPRAAQPTLSL